MIKLRISNPDHPGGLHSTCSSLPMSFLYLGGTKLERAARGVTSAEERGDDQVHQPSGHAPFRTAPAAVGRCCRGLLLAGIQPNRTPRPSSPPRSAITGVMSIPGVRTWTLSSLNVMRFLQSQSSRQPCPPAYRLRPPLAPVCSGRERGFRNWLRKKNSESCCGWLLGLE